jgi:hypothetical protein
LRIEILIEGRELHLGVQAEVLFGGIMAGVCQEEEILGAYLEAQAEVLLEGTMAGVCREEEMLGLPLKVKEVSGNIRPVTECWKSQKVEIMIREKGLYPGAHRRVLGEVLFGGALFGELLRAEVLFEKVLFGRTVTNSWKGLKMEVMINGKEFHLGAHL